MRQQVPKSSAADSYKSPIDPQPSHSPPPKFQSPIAAPKAPKAPKPQSPQSSKAPKVPKPPPKSFPQSKKVRIRHISHAPTTQYVLNANLLEGSRVPSYPNPAAATVAAAVLAAAVVAAAIAEASITAAASIPAAAIPAAPPHTAAPSLQPSPLQPHPFSTQNFEYEEIVEQAYSGFHVFSVGCAPSLCSISLLHMAFYLQVWFSESSRPEFCEATQDFCWTSRSMMKQSLAGLTVVIYATQRSPSKVRRAIVLTDWTKDHGGFEKHLRQAHVPGRST